MHTHEEIQIKLIVENEVEKSSKQMKTETG